MYAMGCRYVIKQGNASVSIDLSIVAELEEGQFFGEQALMNDAPRTATIRATSHRSSPPPPRYPPSMPLAYTWGIHSIPS